MRTVKEGRLRDSYFGHQHVTIITPRSQGLWSSMREIFAYRELLWVLILKDVKVRYKQTLLGATWALIRPLASLAIFTILFGKIAKIPSEGYPYSVFVFSGLLPWLFHASAVTASATSLVGSSQLVTKVYFPRAIIPLSTIGGAFVDFMIALMVFIVYSILLGVNIGFNVLWLPVLTIPMVTTAMGVGMLLAAVTVRYRDVVHAVPFLVQIWMYLTPVIYPVNFIPGHWQFLLYINPVTAVVEAFRAVVLNKTVAWPMLGLSFTIGLVLLTFGFLLFRRVERGFADVI